MKKTVKTILSVALAVVIAFSGIGSVEARAAKKNDFSKEINMWLVPGLDGLPLFGITPYDFVSENAPKKRVTKVSIEKCFYGYKYDKAGRIKEVYYSEKAYYPDSSDDSTTFYYDDEDNLIKQKFIYSDDDEYPAQITTFTTDKKGRVIKAHWDNSKGGIMDKTYTYKGDRIKKIHFDSNYAGNSSFEHKYTYDSLNRLVSIKCVTGGNVTFKDTFKYDEKGRICSAKRVKANSNHSYTFSYDKDGYLLKIQRDDGAERCLYYETVK